MIVVSDTSALYYAAQIGFVSYFPSLFGRIIIPGAVYKELMEANAQPFVSSLLMQPWLKIIPVKDQLLIRQLHTYVDLGESEAIALAMELSAGFLLIDERRGRHLAAGMGIRIIGLLGVFLMAKEKGLIPAIKPWLEQVVSQTAFRQSPQLIAKVLEIAGEE